jgi:cytochrome c-type biogenesis protein CcmH/NrfF
MPLVEKPKLPPRKVWITAMLLWLLPGGMLWAFIYLIFHKVKRDPQAPAWYKASLAEFMREKRARKEATHDIHSVSNQ